MHLSATIEGTSIPALPPTQAWITIAAANVLPEVLLRLASSIISARGYNISRYTALLILRYSSNSLLYSTLHLHSPLFSYFYISIFISCLLFFSCRLLIRSTVFLVSSPYLISPAFYRFLELTWRQCQTMKAPLQVCRYCGFCYSVSNYCECYCYHCYHCYQCTHRITVTIIIFIKT
jgi:hypothetical protein